MLKHIWNVLCSIGCIVIFSFVSCQDSNSQNSVNTIQVDSGVVTGSGIRHEEFNYLADSSGEIHLDTAAFDSFLFDYYKYDSTFGKSINAVKNENVTKDRGVEKTVTSFKFDNHKLVVENRYYSDRDSLVTSFFYDTTRMNIIKNDEGKLISSIDLNYGEVPLIVEYSINKRLYYYLEGLPKEASGRFAKIVYGIVFDVSDKRIFGISTFEFPGGFFFKKEMNGLNVLLCRPLVGNLEDSDSLIVEIKKLN